MTRDEAPPRAVPPPLAGLIAVVGCDGTGKTRLVADLVARLGAARRVERHYMGLISGETGDAIKRLPLLGVWLERRFAAKARRAQDMAEKLPGTATAIVMYLLSRWRAGKLRRLLRAARRGALVIAERYPQAEIPGFNYDGPGLARDRAENRVTAALAAREQRLYERMAAVRPALVIRLTIDADTAQARKPDHPLAELRDKIATIPRIGYNHAVIREIDARMPYPQVLAAALRAVAAVAPTGGEA